MCHSVKWPLRVTDRLGGVAVGLVPAPHQGRFAATPPAVSAASRPLAAAAARLCVGSRRYGNWADPREDSNLRSGPSFLVDFRPSGAAAGPEGKKHKNEASFKNMLNGGLGEGAKGLGKNQGWSGKGHKRGLQNHLLAGSLGGHGGVGRWTNTGFGPLAPRQQLMAGGKGGGFGPPGKFKSRSVSIADLLKIVANLCNAKSAPLIGHTREQAAGKGSPEKLQGKEMANAGETTTTALSKWGDIMSFKGKTAGPMLSSKQRPL